MVVGLNRQFLRQIFGEFVGFHPTSRIEAIMRCTDSFDVRAHRRAGSVSALFLNRITQLRQTPCHISR